MHEGMSPVTIGVIAVGCTLSICLLLATFMVYMRFRDKSDSASKVNTMVE